MHNSQLTMKPIIFFMPTTHAESRKVFVSLGTAWRTIWVTTDNLDVGAWPQAGLFCLQSKHVDWFSYLTNMQYSILFETEMFQCLKTLRWIFNMKNRTFCHFPKFSKVCSFILSLPTQLLVNLSLNPSGKVMKNILEKLLSDHKSKIDFIALSVDSAYLIV